MRPSLRRQWVRKLLACDASLVHCSESARSSATSLSYVTVVVQTRRRCRVHHNVWFDVREFQCCDTLLCFLQGGKRRRSSGEAAAEEARVLDAEPCTRVVADARGAAAAAAHSAPGADTQPGPPRSDAAAPPQQDTSAPLSADEDARRRIMAHAQQARASAWVMTQEARVRRRVSDTVSVAEV
jgi:hypothetical protein